MNIMEGINSYFRQLSSKDIEEKKHRGFVGGMWDEIGALQFEFLVNSGLKPKHKLLDIGCGCLRGGVKYIDYLDLQHYHGVDINESLIKAAYKEIEEYKLEEKQANLIVSDSFEFEKFGTQFDYMVSISLFTHLPLQNVVKCLIKARESLTETGTYYATYFESPFPAYLDDLEQKPGGKVTKYDRDPFHYSNQEIEYIAELAGLKVEIIGDWGHPRNQKMAAFRHKKTAKS
ncbi:class I SAM-dependent methyltransferase [Psychrosphaera haliotis]|uniref:Methyltransferase domain-containing protein n=1 Tax=Psychrosphaera haliotis TaxID=555083 RepID=A0A6N8FDZ8_9GAMM|nr:class I SAM-dependent methyltransferase [Psychrosphaera haliotis]MUH73210.1 methyltransferase domain-containing protein [Psychrosphaera haliotis]